MLERESDKRPEEGWKYDRYWWKWREEWERDKEQVIQNKNKTKTKNDKNNDKNCDEPVSQNISFTKKLDILEWIIYFQTNVTVSWTYAEFSIALYLWM